MVFDEFESNGFRKNHIFLELHITFKPLAEACKKRVSGKGLMKGSGKLLRVAALRRRACLPCTASHKAPPGSFVKWTVHSLTLKSCRKQLMVSAEPSKGITNALGSISSTAASSCCK